MILIKIGATMILVVAALFLPAIIVNITADRVLQQDLGWIEAFKKTLKGLNPYPTFLLFVIMLLAIGCIDLIWT